MSSASSKRCSLRRQMAAFLVAARSGRSRATRGTRRAPPSQRPRRRARRPSRSTRAPPSSRCLVGRSAAGPAAGAAARARRAVRRRGGCGRRGRSRLWRTGLGGAPDVGATDLVGAMRQVRTEAKRESAPRRGVRGFLILSALPGAVALWRVGLGRSRPIL